LGSSGASIQIAFKTGDMTSLLSGTSTPGKLSMSSTKARLLLENEEYIAIAEELNDMKIRNEELTAKLEANKKE
jgi:hypothetical protein